jgi:hypothetical protein
MFPFLPDPAVHLGDRLLPTLQSVLLSIVQAGLYTTTKQSRRACTQRQNNSGGPAHNNKTIQVGLYTTTKLSRRFVHNNKTIQAGLYTTKKQ